MIKSETIEKAIQAITKRRADYEYFYNKLDSPDWLKPLWKEGFFCKPEPIIAEGKYISFPLWPESQYLARMAAKDPDTVCEIILKIPNTDNARVHDDLASAALNMPPQVSARLVDKAAEWIESPYHLLLPDHLGKLIEHLAKGNEVDAALALARSLLDVAPPQIPEKEDDKEDLHKYEDAKPLFEEWAYEHILKKNIPALVSAAKIKVFELLCDLLEKSVIGGISKQSREDKEDFSYIWRPAIENHEQNVSHGLKSLLVTALRSAADLLMKDDLVSINDIVAFLEARPYSIFKRLTLYILRQHPAKSAYLVTKYALDCAVFDDYRFFHEYFLLIRVVFESLAPSDQNTILGWINNGPSDVEDHKRSYKEMYGKELSDSEVKDYINHWIIRRLAVIKEVLPAETKAKYDALVSKYGEPKHSEFRNYHESWVGPTSPIGNKELSEMPVDDIINYLSNWKPSTEMFAPTPEGLGRLLTDIVSAEPERFAKAANNFRGLDPTYVRALLGGFSNAARNKKAFDWGHVLELCQGIVSQSIEISGRDVGEIDADPSWEWTRQRIAHLLDDGFHECEGCIPFQYRSLAWSILVKLTNDPTPTPEDEERYGGSNMRPAELSINSTRGEALHAVIQHALWIRRHNDKKSNAKELASRGFDEMPEVEDVLNNHLDISKESSLAVRSVYGQWFPWLVLLDKKWAQESAAKIFPTDDSHIAHRNAAWHTYLAFCAPYTEVYDLLKEQYLFAANNLVNVSETERAVHETNKRLAEHLITYYWRGKLELDDSESSLSVFYEKASDSLRAHVMAYIGRPLEKTKEAIEDEVLDRLRSLWEKRLDIASKSANLSLFKSEIASFGWWYVSGKFDYDWSLDQLSKALKISKYIDPAYKVIKKLADNANINSLQVIDCIDIIIKEQDDQRIYYGWQDDTKMLLSKLMNNSDSAVVTKAKNLANYLIAKGYGEIRELFSNGTK